MSNPLTLFGSSLAPRLAGLPALTITGSLPDYTANVAYSNRLQINNAVGDCSLNIIDATLPPGATVYIDQATDEIVVSWPAYATPDPMQTAVLNGDLELGNAYMQLGAGWSIGTGGFPTTGVKTAQYDGAGASTIQWTKERCAPGTVITGAVDVQQGASSAGSVGAASYILFFDANGKQIQATQGTVIFSGSNSVWQTSSVTATAPAGTFYAAMAASATRKRQNKPLWVDNARWDLSYPTGTPGEEDFNLSLSVTDSAGRIAYWSGSFSEFYIYFTSKPYTALGDDDDGYTLSAFLADASFKVGLFEHALPHEDSYTFAAYFDSASTRSLNWEHAQPNEDAYNISAFYVDASTRVIQWTHTQPQEDNYTLAAYFDSASTKTALVNNTIPEENYTISPFFVSASTT